MQIRLVPFFVFGVLVSGCNQSHNEYVDFDKTEPSALEEKRPENDSAQTPESSQSSNAELPSSVEVITPAKAIGTPDGSGVTQADSKEVTSKEPSNGANSTVITSAHSGLQGPADTPIVENEASSEPRKIELLIPEKHLRKERGTSAVRVTFDDIDLLKVLNMEPVPVDALSYFPDWLKSLDGKPIRIRGYMYPTYEATGLKSFSLVRDTGICCFVRQPKIYDIISVAMAEGVTADYMELRPFDVEGTLHIEPQADEKDLARLYRIDNARVLH